jgi:hypothetical protein
LRELAGRLSPPLAETTNADGPARVRADRPDPHESEAARFAMSASGAPAEPTQISSAGGPLRPDTRDYYESRLGVDLSRVRVRGDDSARASGAYGYAFGDEIVLGSRRPAGLLAHELAHVAQQAGGAPTAGLSAAPHRVQRWDSFEHVELGESAAGGPTSLITLQCHDRDFKERATPATWPLVWTTRLASATPEQRRAAAQGLTYGEVVALSGDFYGKYMDLSGAQHSPFEALDIAPLWEIVQLIPLIRGKATTSQLQQVTGGRYLDLAKKNVSHFSNVPVGQRNIDVWSAMHRDALMLAQQAAADPSFANRAWATNAAADHFLTDAFSGGHVRTPRAQLLAQGDLGNVESKILHDLDNTYGVEVTNKRGDPAWIAYGDDALSQAGNATNRRLALDAVELSKRDIANAIAQGPSYVLPPAATPFASEALVPFPVDPSKDRWTGRTPTYRAGPHGPVRVADNYTQMRDDVIAREAPGVIAGFFNDDDQIRAWVSSADLGALGRQPVGEKIRMIDTLLGGFFSWITDADVNAIVRICQSVPDPAEMRLLRDRFYADIPSRMSDIGQRTRVRIALTRI